jgi:predicted Zn finger-like uncharacterized protein
MKLAQAVLTDMAVVPCGAEEPPESRMKFVCDRCQTRYSIADEKVRQKILRIRCKTCGNVILVQESSVVPEGEGGVPTPHPRSASSGLRLPPPAKTASEPKLAPPVPARPASEPKLSPPAPARPGFDSKLPSAPRAGTSGLKVPSLPPSKLAPGLKTSTGSSKARFAVPPPPPSATVAPDPLGGRVEWYVAVAGAQSGPFSRGDAAKRIVALDPAKAVHVWKEGMSGWKPPSEVSVIAREINLLRPVPPPPPPAALTPPPAAHAPKQTATPAPLAQSPAHTEKAHPEKPHAASADAFPGKPVVPIRASSIAEVSDFQADGDTENDVFADVTTQKKKRVIEAAPTFTDATTKKGKNLRDLEADPLLAPSVDHVDEQKTPPPVQPSVPVAKRTDPSLIRASLGEPPTLPSPPSFTPAPQAIPTVTFDPAPVAPHAAVPGFDEVVAAMSAVAPASLPPDSAPAAVVPVMTAAYVPSTEVAVRRSRVADLLQARSGLKYLVAALVLVALVILLVVFSLRADGSKKPAVNREPVPEETVTPDPAKTPEEPALAQPSEERAVSPSRSGAKHSGAAVKTRSVGPSGPVATERPVAPSRPVTKPGKGDSARPNPFDDSVQPVSQDKISAVVRDRNNQMALKSCYERALKMDNHLTSGRMDVTVSIATTGIVKSVVVNAPSSFIMVEPCIKLAVRRWRFPPNFEEYGTNFPLIMQGGM